MILTRSAPVILPPVPGLVKVTVHTSYGGRQGANIFHAQSSTPNMAASVLNTVASDFRLFYKNRFLPQLANGLQLQDVIAQDLSSVTGNIGTASGTDSGGDIASGNAPNNVACCVSWHINRHYRGGRPRTYLWGFKNDVFQDTEHFTSTFTSAVALGGSNFITDVDNMGAGGYTWNFVCVHYYGNGGSTTKPPTPLATPLVDVITACTVNPRIDTQRRRLGKT